MPNHASPRVSARTVSARTGAAARPALSSRPARGAARPAAGATSRRAALLTGPTAILAAAVLWGTTGTASTLAPAGARPAAIGSAGLAAGGLLLFFTSRGARSLPAACTRAQRWLLALGALAVAGYPVTFYPAVARTGVAVATTLTLAEPAVATLLGVAVLGQRLPALSWCGLGVLAAGLACLAVPGRRQREPGSARRRR